MFKARLESVEASASNPYIYYNMQLQAIIKIGTSQVAGEMGGPHLGEGQACACSHTGFPLRQARTLRPRPWP